MSIIVLVREASEAEALIHLAKSFSQGLEEQLVIAAIYEKLKEGASDEIEPILVQDLNEELTKNTSLSLVSKQLLVNFASSEIVFLNKKKCHQQILTLASSSKVELLIVSHDSKTEDSTTQEVYQDTKTNLLVVRVNKETKLKEFNNILVPVVGGPHAVAAVQCAERLARNGGSLTLLYVEPSAGDLYKEVGMRRLKYFLQLAGLEQAPHIHLRVELSNDVTKTISEVAENDFELVIIGSSKVGSIRRNLFGTISNKLIASSHGPAIGVFRKKKPLLTVFRDRVEDALDLVVPQLSREERIALFDEIELKSKWNFDFLVLIVLSTVIASLGLLQDSAAVVIGAMLVAPLMTPLLGSGLSVLQENIPLFKRSNHAVFFGFVAAFISSAVVGFCFSKGVLTPQMLARTSPSMLDILVGLLSGLAAAHCVARPGLSAALPGVAIAAALVPPIATSGIAFAAGQYSHTLGAFLLFFTNVAAIIFGSVLSFFGGGVRPKKSEQKGSAWSLKISAILIVVLLGLTAFYMNDPRYHALGLKPKVRASVSKVLESSMAEIEEVNVVRGKSEKLKVLLNITSAHPLSEKVENEILKELEQSYRQKLELEIRTDLLRRIP